MKLVRELNMEADDMQAVLSAISSVSKRIKEVHRHTNRSLAVSTSSQVKKYASGCISALAPCRTIGTGGLSPIRSSQGRYYIRSRIWKGCWKKTTKNSWICKSMSAQRFLPLTNSILYKPISFYIIMRLGCVSFKGRMIFNH